MLTWSRLSLVILKFYGSVYVRVLPSAAKVEARFQDANKGKQRVTMGRVELV